MRLAGKLVLLSTCLTLLCVYAESQSASSIASEDPYRNFVGSWSGTIPFSTDKMPPTVKLRVTEEKDGSRMRWDYVFGVKGDKGYTHDTKWFVLNPDKAQMTTWWKGKRKQMYGTFALDTFAKSGYGKFMAGISWKNKVAATTYNRITVDLHPESLMYLWEVSPDGTNFSTYSRFEFKRDAESNPSVDSNHQQ